jgi:tyrosyl-tRNA synthetase
VTPEQQLEVLKRGVAEMISEAELLQKLQKSAKENKPLRIKLGVDPTAPDIHLGFTVVMRKLAQFQELGHQVVLIIGDYTATIGDPSGKNKTRPRLSHADVLKNAKQYQEQFFKVVHKGSTEVVYNGDWFSTLSFDKVAELLSKMTVAQMLEREDFQNRHKEGNPISLHEFMYPLMQGYDSLVINADVEIGGTDQKFNVLRGRELQRGEGKEPQVGLFMPILLGTCGREKMSKSIGNYVGIDEAPDVMFHKIYNIPDALLESWYLLLTDISQADLTAKMQAIQTGDLSPIQAKADLAEIIVTQYHGATAAKASRELERRIHSGEELPSNTPLVQVEAKPWPLLELLKEVKAFTSNGEARRMVQNGGVRVNGEKVQNASEIITPELGKEILIQTGKRNYYRVTL